MIKNYLIVAFRNLKAYKLFSFINIFGLALGLSCCIIIAFYISSELSYDTFHEKADDIYRVNLFGKIGDNEFNVANSPSPLAEALLEDFPEIEKAVRIERKQDTFIKHNNSIINEENFFYADSTIFEIFTIELLEGNPDVALSSPNTIVLTPEMTNKYFGEENPIGKTILKDDGTEFLITGIVKELPSNSHFHYDFIASMRTIENQFQDLWITNDVYTYILMNKKGSAEGLEKKLPKMVETRVAPQIKAIMGVSFNEFTESGNSIKFFVQPLTKIHLSSETYANIEPGGSLDSIYIFTSIALVILLLACINFVNLTTARSSRRSREVGIRKVLGSSKKRLIKQFLSESLLITFISLSIAICLIELLLPSFNSILDQNIKIDYFSDWQILSIIICSTIILGVIAGSYPSFLLASFKPISVLRGNKAKGIGNGKFRGAVVVFQFVITIILLASTFIIYGQLEFIKNKNLGYNSDRIMVLPTVNELGDQKKEFKNEILRKSDIKNATLTSSLPNRRISATIFRKLNSEDNRNFAFAYNFVDYDFIDTYEIELLEGRLFSRDFSTDTSSILINETAVSELGLESPLESSLQIPSEKEGEIVKLKIIGIVKDFHFENLREKIRPMVINLNEESQANFLSIKIEPENIDETIKFVENQWGSFLPGKAFEYQFMDEDFNNYYKEEQKTGKLFTSFTLLAVFIACLGLLGLISFSVEQRTKEVGIRKVMGATTSTILILLSAEFVKWLLLANIIAIPIVYYLMDGWLQNFAYRENMSFSAFLIAALLSFIIAIATIISHTFKAATANPVESLRSE